MTAPEGFVLRESDSPALPAPQGFRLREPQTPGAPPGFVPRERKAALPEGFIPRESPQEEVRTPLLSTDETIAGPPPQERLQFRELPPDRPADSSYPEIAKKAVSGVLPSMARSAAGIVESIGGTIQAIGPETELIKDAQGNITEIRKRGETPIKRAGREAREYWTKVVQGNQPVTTPGTMKDYIAKVAQGAARMTPAIAFGFAGGPAAALSVVGADVFGDEYGNQIEAGADHQQAALAGIGFAVAEVLGEKIPIDIILKPGGKILTKALKTMAAEGAEEAVTEVLQSGIRKGTIEPDMTIGEAWERVKEAGLVGAGTGGVVGATVGTAQKVWTKTQSEIIKDVRDNGGTMDDAFDALGRNAAEKIESGEVFKKTPREAEPETAPPSIIEPTPGEITETAKLAIEEGPAVVDNQEYKSQSFAYSHNKEKAPDMGDRFGQDVEPSGKYVVAHEDAETAKKTEKYFKDQGLADTYEFGEITFDNPLVINQGEGGTRGWKQFLSSKYGGKKGESLSKAILEDGYDGIITLDKSGISETVVLGEKAKPTPDIEKARAETDTDPSEAQIKSGNYKKGAVNIQGLNISIENPKGSTRSGEEGGKEWSAEMHNDYGYIKNSIGADKENVDVYIGPNLESDQVFVVHQVDPGTRQYDEDKVMVGFDSEESAEAAYRSQYDQGEKVKPDRIGAVTPMDMETFKEKIKKGGPLSRGAVLRLRQAAKKVTAEVPAPKKPIVTGIKLAETTRVRKERGLEPIPAPEVQQNKESLELAKERIKKDPTYVERLVEELAEKSRPISADEVAALDIHYMMLQKEIRNTRKEAESVYAEGAGDVIAEAKRKHDHLESKIAEFEQMYRDTGTETARGLQMRDRLIKENYTLEALESRARAAKGFEPLTTEEKAEIKTLHEKIKTVEGVLSEKEIKIQELQAEAVINKTKKDVSEEYHPGILKQADRIVKSMEKSAESASKRLRGKLSRLTVGVDPTIVADGAIVGSAKIARGTLNFAEWSAEMIKDFGGKIKPYLNGIWKKSNVILDDKLKKVSPKVGKIIKTLSTKEKIEDSKEKIERIMEGSEQEDITFPVRQLVQALVEENPKINRGELVNKVKTILKDINPDITNLEVMDAISGRGKFQLLSQDQIAKTIRDLKTQIRLVGHQMDVEAKKPLPRTGLQRDKMSALARRELQKLNELKRKLGVVVTNPEAHLASVLQTRKRYYTNRISDLRQEIKSKERIVKTKTPSPEDTELINLKKEYAELREEHLVIFGKRKITDKQRLSVALKAAEKTEKRWGDRLQEAKKGIFDKKILKRKITSAELSAIKAKTEAIREEVKDLKNAAFPKKSRLEIALQSTKTRTANRIAELKSKIAANDFSKRPKRKPLEDPALIKLRADLEIVKDEYKVREEKFKWEQMRAFQKFKKITANTYDAARLLMTTGEFSFILRQGKVFALSRPRTTARAIPQTLKAFVSERNAKTAELEIREHPMYAKSQQAKLHITKEGDTLNKQEEFVMGKWSNVIPGVRNFNRAATTFLNKLRYDSWLAMRKTMSKGGESTLEEDKMYARFANEATGRGGLGVAEPAAIVLGRMFFSPRYITSRVQLALGHAMWGGTARSKAVIAGEYAKALIGLGIYYNLLYFGAKAFSGEGEEEPEITFDPRTSDFGKIKIGNTRIDPLAGMAQLATFAGRTVTGESKTTTGKVYKIRGEVPFGKPTWWEVAGRFAAYKGHPVPVTVANLFSGVDLIGNEATIMSEAGKLSSPITYKDIYEAMELQGVPLKVSVSLLTFLGEGLQTYKQRSRKGSRTTRRGRSSARQRP